MKKYIDKLCFILKNITGALMISIIVCVTIQIICRSILKMSTPWTEEIARYLLIWLTFLGSPVALRNGEHLMVDLFYSKYPKKVRRYVDLFCSISVAAFCVYLLYFGIKLCSDPRVINFVSPAARIPRNYIYAALPIGGFLMLVIAVYDIYCSILILCGRMEDSSSMKTVDESKTLAELDELRRKA